jgi:hypothetical protein
MQAEAEDLPQSKDVIIRSKDEDQLHLNIFLEEGGREGGSGSGSGRGGGKGEAREGGVLPVKRDTRYQLLPVLRALTDYRIPSFLLSFFSSNPRAEGVSCRNPLGTRQCSVSTPPKAKKGL